MIARRYFHAGLHHPRAADATASSTQSATVNERSIQNCLVVNMSTPELAGQLSQPLYNKALAPLQDSELNRAAAPLIWNPAKNSEAGKELTTLLGKY